VASFLVAAPGLAVGLVVSARDGGGGRTEPRLVSRPYAPSGGARRGQQTAPSGAGLIGRGPTSIDFINPEHGWIASDALATESQQFTNPTIVRTSDGGRTWHRIPVPNVAKQIVSHGTYRQYGGIVGVSFADQEHGLYEEAGMLWRTSDGGKKWIRVPFDTVIALASTGKNQWVLANTCPVTSPLNPCAKTYLFRSTVTHPRWRRSAKVFTIGEFGGGALTTDGRNVVVSVDGQVFVVTPQGVFHRLDIGCEPIGHLNAVTLAGLCDVGGGGDASTTSFETSVDGGQHWDSLVAGPPSHMWSGVATTNGAGALFYVTGGNTLWRTDTHDLKWSPVLQTPAGSEDEFYPLSFESPTRGLVLESDGLDVHWFETSDAGVTWSTIPAP
jgi:hypothetical protein